MLVPYITCAVPAPVLVQLMVAVVLPMFVTVMFEIIGEVVGAEDVGAEVIKLITSPGYQAPPSCVHAR